MSSGKPFAQPLDFLSFEFGTLLDPIQFDFMVDSKLFDQKFEAWEGLKGYV